MNVGAGNVKAAYRVALEHDLTHAQTRLLVYMAAIALDSDNPPQYWAGHEQLARALGRRIPTAAAAQAARDHGNDAPSRTRETAHRAVRQVLDDLGRLGVVGRLADSAPGRHARYALRLARTQGAHPPVMEGGTQGAQPPVNSEMEGAQPPANGGGSATGTQGAQPPPEEYLLLEEKVLKEEISRPPAEPLGPQGDPPNGRAGEQQAGKGTDDTEPPPPPAVPPPRALLDEARAKARAATLEHRSRERRPPGRPHQEQTR